MIHIVTLLLGVSFVFTVGTQNWLVGNLFAYMGMTALLASYLTVTLGGKYRGHLLTCSALLLVALGLWFPNNVYSNPSLTLGLLGSLLIRYVSKDDRPNRTRLILIGSLFVGVCLYLDRPIVALASFTAGAMCLYTTPKFRWTLFVSAVANWAYIILNHPGLTNERVSYWEMFMGAFLKSGNWLFGEGFNQFPAHALLIQEDYAVDTSKYYLHMHNDYMEIFFNHGAVGLAVFLGFFLYRLWKSPPKAAASLMVLGVASLGHFALFNPIGLLLFYLYSTEKESV